MKINKLLFIILGFFVLVTGLIHANEDEKILQVKLRQGFQFEQQGQISQAEILYKQLLENFPHNSQIVGRLVNLYLRFNQFEKLDDILDSEKDFLPPYIYQLTRIEMLLKENKLSQADAVTEQLLASAQNNFSIHKRVAAIYQKYHLYDQAIDIYISARELANNPTMYAHELAYIYQLQQRFQDALDEYLRILSKSTFKFVRYRLERLDLPYSEIITMLEQKQAVDTTAVLKEMIGEIAVLAKKYEKALSVYSELGNDALIRLSELCEKEGAYDISIRCLKKILSTVNEDDFQTICYLEQKIGDLYYKAHEHEQAYDHYTKVMDLYDKKDVHIPRDQSKNAYKNMAYIELYERKNPVRARELIVRVHELSRTSGEKAEISIMLAESYLREENFIEVENILQDILYSGMYNQELRSLAELKLLEATVLQGNFTRADTLSKDFIALNYESPYVNDVASLYRIFNNELQLKFAPLSIQGAAKDLIAGFFFQDNEMINTAVDSLEIAVQDSLKTEFILVQVADYEYDRRNYRDAADLYNKIVKSFADGNYGDYALFRLGSAYEQMNMTDQAKFYYEKYLLTHPQGAFAPEIRLTLKNFQK